MCLRVLGKESVRGRSPLYIKHSEIRQQETDPLTFTLDMGVYNAVTGANMGKKEVICVQYCKLAYPD
jgi:hypothetical protein